MVIRVKLNIFTLTPFIYTQIIHLLGYNFGQGFEKIYLRTFFCADAFCKNFIFALQFTFTAAEVITNALYLFCLAFAEYFELCG